LHEGKGGEQRRARKDRGLWFREEKVNVFVLKKNLARTQSKIGREGGEATLSWGGRRNKEGRGANPSRGQFFFLG